MGGRGASSAGSRGGVAKGTLVLPDGSAIEFDGELHFDGNDTSLKARARENITNWEARRVKNKIEYAYAVDADGNPLGREIKGGKGSVRVPIYYHDTTDAVFTHIHPRGDGMLGGTFSSGDLMNFANHSQRTVRAAAKEGTYSISKGANFDAVGFKSFVRQANTDFSSSYRTKVKKYETDYRSGKITYNEYLTGNAKAFNTSLVELHEKYRGAQKQYGYSYTLEKV